MENNYYATLDSKYLLQSLIGKGGTSEVYWGYSINDTTKQSYAIKTLNTNTKAKTKIDPYENEKNALKDLNNNTNANSVNPNIITLYNFGIGPLIKTTTKETTSTKYLVLEVALVNFYHLISMPGRPFSEKMSRYIFKQILTGVDICHKKEYFHRDIKPANIMLTHNGDNNCFNIKLTDFGYVASPEEVHMNNSKLKFTVGTLPYMAPEIIRKRSYIGEAIDVFSLGVCFFVLLLGLEPFKWAERQDPFYNLLMKGDYVQYWQCIVKQLQEWNIAVPSQEFVDLFLRMIMHEGTNRLTLSQVLSHGFFNGEYPSQEEVNAEFEMRLNEIRKFRMAEMDLPIKSKVGIGTRKKVPMVFNPSFVIGEFKLKDDTIKDECFIRIKGQDGVVVMNLLAEKMKGEIKNFFVERECHAKKVKMKVVAVNKAYCLDKKENEEKKEEEEESIEIKREVVVRLGLQKERKLKWNVVYMKKKSGCLEDFYLFVKDVKEIMLNL